MIPNPSLGCSYVVLNFWANLSLVLKKVFCLTFLSAEGWGSPEKR